jgi:hypothetical protein
MRWQCLESVQLHGQSFCLGPCLNHSAPLQLFSEGVLGNCYREIEGDEIWKIVLLPQRFLIL